MRKENGFSVIGLIITIIILIIICIVAIDKLFGDEGVIRKVKQEIKFKNKRKICWRI